METIPSGTPGGMDRERANAGRAIEGEAHLKSLWGTPNERNQDHVALKPSLDNS